ncbi:hypothetical protein A3Q56_02857 [Intoshia linei]|uniref:Heparan-sulfate 6-O-sulfotransferase n=1 Tax=Intoshia linei TaxID=1819745 RepID=A0A177B5J3_9BILA|nr:hypothetical protein A3Q56_02857 [Intoshia linei]
MILLILFLTIIILYNLPKYEYFKKKNESKITQFIQNCNKIDNLKNIEMIRKNANLETLENELKVAKLNDLCIIYNKFTQFVFIHIQKTGGTFYEKQFCKMFCSKLIKLKFKKIDCINCIKKLICKSNYTIRSDVEGSIYGHKRVNIKNFKTFLFNSHIPIVSRYTVGWVCGVHADFSHFENCNIKKKLASYCPKNLKYPQSSNEKVYITLIRDPVKRIISEYYKFNEKKGNSMWDSVDMGTKDLSYRYNEIKNFTQFIKCVPDTVLNRMTYMLSNLNKIDFNKLKWKKIILKNAKKNVIEKFIIFGNIDYYQETNKLFQILTNSKILTKKNTFKSKYKYNYNEIKSEILKNTNFWMDHHLYIFLMKKFVKILNLARKQEFPMVHQKFSILILKNLADFFLNFHNSELCETLWRPLQRLT